MDGSAKGRVNMDRLIKSRILLDNGDAEYTLDTGKITVNQHGDGLMRRVLDRLWEYEKRMIRMEMTNGDRIRVMSDEELAKYLFDVEQGNFTIDCCDDRFCDTEHCCHDCTAAAIKWLQQSAEGASK